MFEMLYKYEGDTRTFAARLLTGNENYAWRLAKHNIKQMNFLGSPKAKLVTVKEVTA